MTGATKILAFLIYPLVGVYALSIRPPPLLNAAATAVNATSTRKDSSLTAPDPIDGYDVRLRLDSDSTLVASAVFLVIVEFLLNLGEQSYEGYVPMTGTFIREPGVPEELVISNFPLRSRNKIQWKHVVVATYQAAFALAERSADRPGYLPRVFGQLFIRGQKRAVLFIKHKTDDMLPADSPEESTSTSFVDNSTVVTKTPGVVFNSILSATEGHIRSPKDSRLVVEWKVTGETISLLDAWTALVDLLAQAAAHDTEARGVDVTGIGISRNTEINFHTIAPRHGASKSFTWGQLHETMRLLIRHDLVYQQDWAMDFTIYFDTDPIALGSTAPLVGNKLVKESK
ncbi:MAG: hypothetical protein L6R38_007584 [Xanthoria sp. 2 TBL-2021]|nr:MAG: hypothetical protein L6R38_007584 [Xanthoria sp. 2 TBL-2021]